MYWKERLVIFKEDLVGGRARRARVTIEKEHVLWKVEQRSGCGDIEVTLSWEPCKRKEFDYSVWHSCESFVFVYYLVSLHEFIDSLTESYVVVSIGWSKFSSSVLQGKQDRQDHPDRRGAKVLPVTMASLEQQGWQAALVCREICQFHVLAANDRRHVQSLQDLAVCLDSVHRRYINYFNLIHRLLPTSIGQWWHVFSIKVAIDYFLKHSSSVTNRPIISGTLSH